MKTILLFVPLLFAACATTGPLDFVPRSDGPCIQRTEWTPRKPLYRNGYWTTVPYQPEAKRDGFAVAVKPATSGEVNRMLLAEPLTRRPVQKALAMRGVGYALVAIGLVSIPAVAWAIGRSEGAPTGALGILPGVGVAAIGGVTGTYGNREYHEAIDRYNERAADTGACPSSAIAVR
jgi:hypothetical protein